jgi:hypothetical protein
MDQAWIEELWQRFLAAEALTPDEEQSLRETLDADAALREELLGDERLDATLRTLVRCQKSEEAFLAETRRRLARPASGNGAPYVPNPEGLGNDWRFAVIEPDPAVRIRRRMLPLVGGLVAAAALVVAGLAFAWLQSGKFGKQRPPNEAGAEKTRSPGK